ncbi:uncharacterized protein LOC128551092 isoform X2 [Mercenaria mercenaria]|uniref:uncharacterized protein LOC128551092 isoform X2 n=1 Tax=Mercenaria mercenaria TaxID=6596 RepID=UPI00234ED804|nr:uncharacterized protein LOC128551092 isoform X2 [Mercenaria mercenaria]
MADLIIGHNKGLSGSKGKSIDEKMFEDLYYDLFEKYKTDIEGGYVKIPKDKFTTLHLRVENRVFRSMDRQGKSFIQILNTSQAKPSQLFAENLREELDVRFKMKSRIVQTPEKGNTIVVICNKTDNEAEEQAVKNCLVNIEKEFYKDIILIVLHVKRMGQLPRTSTKSKIQDCEVGTILDMGFEDHIYQCEKNDTAFLEIEKCCLKRQSTNTDVATKPISSQSDSSNMQGDVSKQLVYITNPSETNATKAFVDVFQNKLTEYGFIVNQQPKSNKTNPDQNAFSIIVCNNNSRTGADIDRDVGGKSCDILILLHVVEPNQIPKSAIDQVHNEKLKCIIEMAFTIKKGIYDCEMNRNAFAKLEEIYTCSTTSSTKKQHKQQGACSKHDVAPMSNSSLLGQNVANCTGDPTDEPNKKAKTETQENIVESTRV